MIGGLVRAEPVSMRTGVWETTSESMDIKFEPASGPEVKPPPPERSRICINDGAAMARGWGDASIAGRLLAGSSIVHVVSDDKNGIVSHSVNMQSLSFSMVSPWVRLRAQGASTLIGSRMVLRGDFRRRLEREIDIFSWNISPDGTRRGISGRSTGVMERIGRCPFGTASEPIVPLPANPKSAPAP
jgi:hypothetical protein